MSSLLLARNYLTVKLSTNLHSFLTNLNILIKNALFPKFVPCTKENSLFFGLLWVCFISLWELKSTITIALYLQWSSWSRTFSLLSKTLVTILTKISHHFYATACLLSLLVCIIIFTRQNLSTSYWLILHFDAQCTCRSKFNGWGQRSENNREKTGCEGSWKKKHVNFWLVLFIHSILHVEISFQSVIISLNFDHGIDDPHLPCSSFCSDDA